MFGKNRVLLKATLGPRLGMLVAIPFALVFNVVAYLSPPTDLSQPAGQFTLLILLLSGTGVLAGLTLAARPPVLLKVTRRGIWIHPNALTKGSSGAMIVWPTISGISFGQRNPGENPLLLINLYGAGIELPDNLPMHHDDEGSAICLRAPDRPRQKILLAKLRALQQTYGSTRRPVDNHP